MIPDQQKLADIQLSVETFVRMQSSDAVIDLIELLKSDTINRAIINSPDVSVEVLSHLIDRAGGETVDLAKKRLARIDVTNWALTL